MAYKNSKEIHQRTKVKNTIRFLLKNTYINLQLLSMMTKI